MPRLTSFIRDGLSFDVGDHGPLGGPPVVLLHGFPQTGASWARVVPALVAAGHRVLVPDQRGYSPGARPRGRRAYRLQELVDDVLALADEAWAGTFHLVGHDWGGGVAWRLAADHPDRLRSLTVVSTPHPGALTRSMLRSDQLRRSWYMAAFQIPRLPERMMGRPGFARALRGSGMDEGGARASASLLSRRDAATGAVSWYRALPFDRRPLPPVTVPTLYVWSSGDSALGRWAAEHTGAFVEGPYRFVELQGVSHWIPEEAPDRLAALILEQTGEPVRR